MISAAGDAAGLQPPAGEAVVGRPGDVRLLDSVRAWVVAHDESWAFLVLYVGLAVVLSLWISLFWLVAVVAGHLVLELVRQSHLHRGAGRVVFESLWEIKLDVALVLFALALTVYMETVLGLVGLQSAARLGAASRAAARFASWERIIRGVVLSADDAAQVARALAVRRGGGDAVDTGPTTSDIPAAASWLRPWSVGTWVAIGIGAGCLLLIAVAPLFTDHTTATALAQMTAELRPFP